jgi:hypothetical protein
LNLPRRETVTERGLGRTLGAVLSGGDDDGGEEMVKVLSAADPTLPTWSIARTRTVCEPAERPV